MENQTPLWKNPWVAASIGGIIVFGLMNSFSGEKPNPSTQGSQEEQEVEVLRQKVDDLGLPSLPKLPSNNRCSSNTYNCSDFSTHSEAQAVFEACGGVSNDVHRLDADKDGIACESLR